MKIHFSSEKQDWETPQVLFEKLNKEYQFDIDVASSDQNAKLKNHYTISDNALSQEWEGNVFCNPPYGRELKFWLKKGYEQHQKDPDRKIVFLIPARTDTSYWHDYIFGKAKVIFLRGRLKFEVQGLANDAAPFPSAIVIFGQNPEISAGGQNETNF